MPPVSSALWLMRGQGQKSLKKSQGEPKFAAAFAALGFDRLTPIQKKAVPVIAQKRDTLVIAPTGSGKTECAAIPIFARISRTKRKGRIKALYITPLRALNKDIFRRIERYAAAAGLGLGIRHGDTPQSARRKMTLDPPDVMITTPETLVVLLSQPKVLEALSEIEWVVIDEVHEMLPSERGAQLSISMERLELNSSRELTRIGLSATVGNIADAAKFVVGTGRKCKIVQDRSIRKYDVDVLLADGGLPNVIDAVIKNASETAKDSPVLVFTNTRSEAELMTAMLREKLGGKIPVDLHHGSLSREVREESESSLRSGRGGLVVCTSSLELGIDIGNVELVIHYGSPRQVSRLVQRIGRSHHSSGKSARGVIITSTTDDYIEARAILDRVRTGSIESQAVHTCALDVLAHHIVGLAIQLDEVPIGHALELFQRAYPFRSTTLDDLVQTISLLESANLVRLDSKSMSYTRRGRSVRYHYENLSTIRDILKFRVYDTARKSFLGTLDQRFVGDYGEEGNIFVLRGMHWRILNVDEKALRINVEPHRAGGITVPYWRGENIPIDSQTARRAASFRTRKTGMLGRIAARCMANAEFDAPDQSNIVIESCIAEQMIVIHVCYGTRINATLATLLSLMLSSLVGRTVETRSDAYRIAVSSQARISKNMLYAALGDRYEEIATLVQSSLAGSHNVNWHTWCVAKRFGLMDRTAVYDQRDARIIYSRYLGTPITREAIRELYHDKYDLEGTLELLAKIQNKGVNLVWADVGSFSDLAGPILGQTVYRALASNVDRGIIEMVKARLLKAQHRLVCMRCGKWSKLVETSEVRDAPACPRCRAHQITATYKTDEDIPRIINRKRAGKTLGADDARLFRRSWKVASLVANFGRTALIVLSGYGVGADTAARILRDMTDEDAVYKQVYEAERRYVMTRGFWDD